jgi:hypothetical protein
MKPARVNLHRGSRREWQDDYSFFAQDVWRWKPTVTVTAVRYRYAA